MTAPRDAIIDTACELLEIQGFHATGINQLVRQSGAPKGSVYHYFPAGKDEIAAAAIDRAGRTVAARIAAGLQVSDDPALAVQRFVLFIADQVEASGYRSGGPLTAVAMETATTNERLNAACRDAYGRLQAAFQDRLARAGYDEAQARQLGTFITASIEGGIILSRTYHSGDPLRLVAQQLGSMLAAVKRVDGRSSQVESPSST